MTILHLCHHVNNIYGTVIQTAIHSTNVSYIWNVNTNVTIYFPKTHTVTNIYVTNRTNVQYLWHMILQRNTLYMERWYVSIDDKRNMLHIEQNLFHMKW